MTDMGDRILEKLKVETSKQQQKGKLTKRKASKAGHQPPECETEHNNDTGGGSEQARKQRLEVRE